MLSLRISAPAALTNDVVEILAEDPRSAACGTAVSLGSAARYLVLADVAREAANDVIDRLQSLGVPHEGSVHIEPATTWLSQSGLDAERRTPGSSADAVVWAAVVQRSYDESELNWTYLSFMTLAT